MLNQFSKNITPFVKREIMEASKSRKEGKPHEEFQYLENAHVLGQESTYWHVLTHILMLSWAFRHRSLKEVFGQCFRIIGAATKTVFGLVPSGNTGGANVSPFKVMPISTKYSRIINCAKKNL